jgi:hypothetical protein
MSELAERIDSFIAKAAQIPPETAPQVDIAARFDPGQYAAVKPVRDALDSLVRHLQNFRTQTDDATFDSAPQKIRSEFWNLFSSAEAALTTTLDSIKIQERGGGSVVVQPRLSNEGIASLVNKIRDAEAGLFRLSPLFQRTPDASWKQLNEALAQAYTERAKLERRTEDAAATVLSAENIAELDKAITAHERSARNWLFIFPIMCAIMLSIFISIWRSQNDSLAAGAGQSVGSAMIYLFGKLLLVSFGLGLCIFSGRIYQTHAHNIIVNRQRRIASISFLQLYRAIDATDQSGKQELIKQAGQAIFAQTSTGFLRKSGNEFTPLAPLISEIIKSKKG